MIRSDAHFSLPPGEAVGSSVKRTGKLFELGNWGPSPNRPAGFSLNASEADAIVGTTVPLEIEHAPSFLDGKLGTATFSTRNGNDLDGFLTLAKEIDDLHGPTNPIKVSVVWDAVTKKPLRVGLVVDPAIDDAVVTAAFSASGAKPLDPVAIYAARNGGQAAFSGAGVDSASIYASRRGHRP